MKKFIALLLVLTFVCTGFVFTATVNAEETITSTAIYVAVDGNNANDGTMDSPLATIEGARDKIREIKKSTGLPAGGITVYIKNGTYRVKEQIKFTEEDSGTPEAPIIYKAWGEGKTRFLGGIEISGKNFEKITTDDPNYERLQTTSAKENVKVYDLSKDLTPEEYSGKTFYNGKEYDPWSVGGRGASGLPGIEVFYNDKAMDAARWPNRDDDGNNVYAQFASLVSQAEGNGVDYKGPVYKYLDKRIEKYETAKNASIVNITGYWTERSSFQIDPSKGEISIDHGGEALYHWMLNTTYYYEHIFEELDKEGEYYVDYDTGKLYVYGGSDINDATIGVSVFGQKNDDAILRIDKASNITFSGLDIGLARANGIHITSGTDVKITDCNVFDVGLAGIVDGALYGAYSTPYMRGRGYSIYHYDCGREVYREAAGYYHNYIYNHIYNTGFYAIAIRGGDRIDLDPANHNVINCEIHDTGRYEASVGGALELMGVGINAIGNTIYNIPMTAIRFGNNDSVIEYNEIYNCMQEGNDMGVIYGTGWDASNCAGLEIRYNYIHDVPDVLTGSGFAGDGDSLGLDGKVSRRIAIYADDCKPFLEMHHNIFENMPIGITSHGGAEHNMNNNIFINVRKPLLFEGYAETIKSAYEEGGVEGMWDGFCGGDYKAMDNPAWREKHPEVFEVKEELEQRASTAHWGGQDCKGNYCVFYTNPKDCTDELNYHRYTRAENNTFTTSGEGFADAANRDYSFTENSKIFETHPNLKSIDFKKIGRDKNKTFEVAQGTAFLEIASATTTEITLNYSAEVIDGDFTLTHLGTPVETAFTKTNDGKTVVIKPNEPLALDTVYEIHTSDITNYAGGTLSQYDRAFKLETVSESNTGTDGYKLVVLSELDVTPELESTSATTTEFTLNYDATVINGTFRITHFGVPVTVSVSKLNNGKKVVVTPENAFSPDTVYELHISNITDYAGETIDEYKKIFKFKTLSENDDGTAEYEFVELSDVPANFSLENVSATRSEITLDYNAEVIGGTFTLKQNGSTVDATVTKTNNNKSVIIEPVSLLSLDTAYEINATGIPDYNGGTLAEYNKAFILEKMFEDDFDSYSTASDMDGVWIVSFKGATEYNTVSGFNADAKQNGNITDNVYDIEKDSNGNGKLVINQNYGNYILNIKAADTSKWKNYTLEMTVEKDNGTNYNLDIFYHLLRENGGPNDIVRNFRLGLWNGKEAQHYFSSSNDGVGTGNVFNKNSHNLIFTTKTGKDLQVYSDRTEVLSRDFGTNSLGTGEIGFRKTSGDTNKQYIDNVLVYKYVELTEVPENFALENISATKSEITLDYNASVLGGNFVLTKGGEAVKTTVTKINNDKSVVIKPANGLSLDTAYEIKATDIPNYNGGTLPKYKKTFMLKTLFADDFSYTSVSEMDSVWNVSYFEDKGNMKWNKDYTVSGYNKYVNKNVFDLENGWLVINGNNGDNATINIKSNNMADWKNYTLELDVKRDLDARYRLDILYHMNRNDGRPNDIKNNFRLGLWDESKGSQAVAYFLDCNDYGHGTKQNVFTNDTHHLKLTTKAGNDLQVFKDGTNVLSQTYGTSFGIGEIGFKVISGDDKQYIDNVVAYKLVELENKENSISVKEVSVTAAGVKGTYSLAKDSTDSVNSAEVIAVAYTQNDKLLGMQVIPLTSVVTHDGAFEFTCNTPQNIGYVKVYLWNSVGEMIPVAVSGIKNVE